MYTQYIQAIAIWDQKSCYKFIGWKFIWHIVLCEEENKDVYILNIGDQNRVPYYWIFLTSQGLCALSTSWHYWECVFTTPINVVNLMLYKCMSIDDLTSNSSKCQNWFGSSYYQNFATLHRVVQSFLNIQSQHVTYISQLTTWTL